jgi:hypothetical protein
MVIVSTESVSDAASLISVCRIKKWQSLGVLLIRVMVPGRDLL